MQSTGYSSNHSGSLKNRLEKMKNIPTPVQRDNIFLNDKAAPLPVVRPLVLQPLPVSLDTANLLAVVVRHGVRNRVRRGINTESTDSVKELFLFLCPDSQSVTVRGKIIYQVKTPTLAKDDVNLRFTNDQTPLPTNGPNSHPPAPQAIVAMPRTTKGSNPITCAPSDSISWVERY